MRSALWCGWTLAGLMAFVGPVAAQQASGSATLPAPNTVAAVVNGQEIPEVAVQRALRRIPPAKQKEARTEIVNFLIDNALVDQYLVGRKVQVQTTEVDAKINELTDAVKKQGKTTLEKALEDANITVAELRKQIEAQLRWDKFATEQATDARAKAFFEQNKEMFDGTTVRARHILLTPGAGEHASEETTAKLTSFKKEISDKVTQGLAQLPANTDTAGREKARDRLLEEAFSDVAKKESACPSKQKGGDLGYFPRAGMMVEPFARAAFALKPYQVSDVVTTPFGQHLILVVDRKPGKDINYEKIKDVVKEVYGDYLRESVARQLRAKAAITIK